MAAIKDNCFSCDWYNPSISFTKCGKYFEIIVDFLKWEYYSAYSLDFEDDE